MKWFGLLAMIAFCAKAQVPTAPNFDSRVSLVEVDAQVIGKSGTIDGLQAKDFAVQDNRQPVTLRYCSYEETPLDIVLLFELSRFMRPKLEQMRIPVESALAELREGDRAAVMSFAKTTQLEFPLTGDLTALKPKIRSGLAGATFAREPGILAAADAGAKYLAQFPEPHGRRVVLIFTGDVAVGFTGDNGVSAPRALVNSATASAVFQDADTALSAMVIPNSAARILRFDPLDIAVNHLTAIVNFDDFVEDVAQQTGGEVVFAEKMPRNRCHAESKRSPATGDPTDAASLSAVLRSSAGKARPASARGCGSQSICAQRISGCSHHRT